MTFRIVILGKRREGISHKECIEYLRDEHVPIVRQIPGLSRFTVSTPLHPAEAGYDEMAELQFNTEEDLGMATNSEDWQRVIEDAENFVSLDESVVVTVGDRTIHYQSIPDRI